MRTLRRGRPNKSLENSNDLSTFTDQIEPIERGQLERHLSLYDGRDRIGMVIACGDRCDAFDVHGVHLGSFRKLKAAVSAVNSSLVSSCVCDTSARRDNS